MNVTATCTAHGQLYVSSSLKAEEHRQRAITKAQEVAKKHNEGCPASVEVDPCEPIVK